MILDIQNDEVTQEKDRPMGTINPFSIIFILQSYCV